MDGLSPINRPVTIRDISVVFGAKPASIESLLRRHKIGPACRIAGVRCYGASEIRRLVAAMGVRGPA